MRRLGRLEQLERQHLGDLGGAAVGGGGLEPLGADLAPRLEALSARAALGRAGLLRELVGELEDEDFHVWLAHPLDAERGDRHADHDLRRRELRAQRRHVLADERHAE